MTVEKHRHAQSDTMTKMPRNDAEVVQDKARVIMNAGSVMSRVPTALIRSQQDLDHFRRDLQGAGGGGRSCYGAFKAFIERLNDSVKGRTLREVPAVEACSAGVQGVLAILAEIEGWIDSIAPIRAPGDTNDPSVATASGTHRFGNTAYTVWLDRVRQKATAFQRRLFDVPGAAAVPAPGGQASDGPRAWREAYRLEVRKYFTSSFGHRRRIDYGTGHEAHFMAWLYCLQKLGVLAEDAEECAVLVLVVFDRYLLLMRKLQFTYWLEPAGSHGVWGLDDYHFLPFLFGSAQLVGHRHLRPKSIHNTEIVEEYARDYMYLGCIKFINEVKTASLRWHSPMLDDISGVKTWEKINRGMLRMFDGDVLGKLPIMQHFLFGTLLPFDLPGSETASPGSMGAGQACVDAVATGSSSSSEDGNDDEDTAASDPPAIAPPTAEALEQRKTALRRQLPSNAPESMVDRLARQQHDLDMKRRQRQRQRRRAQRRRRRQGASGEVGEDEEGDVTDYEEDLFASASVAMEENQAITQRLPGEGPDHCDHRLPSAMGEAVAKKRHFLPFD